MTRSEFLGKLRQGLAGLPPLTQDEIVADYDNHFNEGIAEGRSESELAIALGDPARLARELKLEAGIRRWEQEKNPSAALGAVIGLLGLGAIDILILLPLLVGVVSAILSIYFAMIVLFFAGGMVFVAGPFTGFPGGVFAALLAGLGIMASATFVTALSTAASTGLVHALIWYGRLHYRVIKPAIEPAA